MSDAIQTDLELPDIDWEHYDTGGKVKAPPQVKGTDGKYKVFYVQAPADFPEEAFTKTQQGFFKVNLDPLVLVNNGEGDGYTIRFESLSAKQYTDRKTGNPINASQLGNYLMAAKVPPPIRDVDAYKAAIRATAGQAVPALLEWEVYDKQTQQTLRNKYDEFDGPAGAKSPVITTPDGRTLVARARVKSFIIPRQ